MKRARKSKPVGQQPYPALHLVAIAGFVASGFLALAYEICWIRKASLVFGNATFALSTVLAVFFGGLALGSYFFGRLSSRTRRPLRVYAILEIGVGILALVSPAAFLAADAAYGWFYPAVYQHFALLSLIRFLLMVLILLPPTILMGGTLPLFCRQYVRSERRISRSVGLLYGLNTFGAAAGCAVCGFFLIPNLGVNVTIWIGAVLNIAIGCVIWLLPFPAMDSADQPVEPAPPGSTDRMRRVTISWLFFLTGFVALGNEILWTRFLSLLMQNTVYRYTLTLTVVLLGIVLGSVLSGWVFDRMRRRALVFGAVQMATAISVLTILMLPAEVWRQWLDPQRMTEQVWLVVMILLLPAVLSGISFPLAIRMVVDDPATAGAGVGRMTALNTFGGIAGALITGFLVLPYLGLANALLITTGLSLFIGLIAWMRLERSASPLIRYGLAAVCVATWLAIPRITGTRLPADFLAPRVRLVDFREGLSAHVALVREGEMYRLEVDRLWQGENVKTHQIMAAHVPMLLHPDPREVLVIGIGPGQTAARFLMYPIERLDCVEIEREIIELVEQYFESQWLNDQRTRVIVEDGRNFLAHTNARYDVISIEVGQAFRPGVAAFYTTDFYRRAHGRLKTGGLISQFVPIAMFNQDELRTVVRSFLDVFPNAVLWYNRAELLLMGSVGGDLKLSDSRLAVLRDSPQIYEDMRFAHWGGPRHHVNQVPNLTAGFLMGSESLAQWTGSAPLYRDDHPYLEYTTARARDSMAAPNKRVLEPYLDPIRDILAGARDEAFLAQSKAMRQSNLMNLEATAQESLAEEADRLNRPKEALKLFRKAVELNPQNIHIRHKLARHLRSVGAVDEVIAQLQQALSIDPEFALAHNSIGYEHAVQGRQEEALKHFRRALELRPRYYDAHYNVAVALASLGRFEDAIPHYRQALEVRPDLAEAHNNLGFALASTDRIEEAIKHFHEALRIAPDSASPHYNLGLALSTSDRLEEGIKHFRRALEMEPGSAMAHNSLGRAMVIQGKLEEAIQHFREAVRLKPDFADAQRNLNGALKMRDQQRGSFGGSG